MNDLISRQAAIDAISCDITVTGRQNAELVAATIGAFADRIKALPSAQPEPQWIPCSERLPEAGKYVLRTIRKFGWHGEEYWSVDIGPYNTNDGSIIAWMPLPEPWKEKPNEIH